ncbi:MAG: inorganic phosphate transporter [Bacteroidota bacterium]|nr:inorganic phosphate transporter [Bacteroidota bacterium]
MFTIYLIPLLIAMFLALTMGGSGTAPAFSAAYGADLIRKDLIPGLFGVMVFAGAIIAGKAVAQTLGQGIIESSALTITLTSIILLSVGLSLLIANLLGVPQSTSQSTVFALSGPALYFDRFDSNRLFVEIIPVWFVLPIIAFVIIYFGGKYIYIPLRTRNKKYFDKLASHRYIKPIVILTSCYVAFSIGSNNVGNASGPIASMVTNELNIENTGNNGALVLIVITLIIAPCFGIGSSIFGYKLVRSSGKDLINIGPLAASAISFLTASLLLFASVIKGIPTSLVQLNTGAIIALGITKVGWKTILSDPNVKKFWIVWIIAPLFSLLLSFVLTFIANRLHLL